MSSREGHHYWEDVGVTRLMSALLLAPLAWLLDLQVSYALVKWTCAHDRPEVLFLVSLGSLTLIGGSAWLSWSALRTLRGDGRLEGGRMEDRNYFLALAGLAMSGIFALLVVTSLAPRYLLSPCE